MTQSLCTLGAVDAAQLDRARMWPRDLETEARRLGRRDPPCRSSEATLYDRASFSLNAVDPQGRVIMCDDAVLCLCAEY